MNKIARALDTLFKIIIFLSIFFQNAALINIR